MSATELIQALCDATAAAAAASAGPPSDAQEREICALMERISAADLRLSGPTTQRKRADGPALIYTQSVFESEAFDIVVFLLPAGASIPLHDHPGMTVFSKILYGELGMPTAGHRSPMRLHLKAWGCSCRRRCWPCTIWASPASRHGQSAVLVRL